jgi:4-hydroxy-tetrahydrodipicolinate synthase
MAVGGDGVISVFTNAFPAQMKKLTDAFLSGKISEAQRYNNLYLEMMNALFFETSPGPLKYIMNKMGLCENVFRLPLAPVSKKTESRLDEVFDRFSKLN